MQLNEAKIKIAILNKERTHRISELEKLNKDVNRLNEQLTNIKNSSKKGGFLNSNRCRMCDKQFDENENYNWSCRFH